MAEGYVEQFGAGAVQTPDVAALDPGSTYEFRVLVDVDWTPAGNQTFGSKWVTSGNQRSWLLQQLSATGRAQLLTTPTGATPTVAANGGLLSGLVGPMWVRFIHTASTGAVEFFTSPDESTWTARGSGTVTTGALFDSTAPTEAGGGMIGKVYAARVFVGGALVADPDFRNDIQWNGSSWVDSFDNEWVLTGDAVRVAPTSDTPTHARTLGQPVSGLLVP